MINPVTHFEVMANPGGKTALRDFYASTFGWEYQVAPEMDYAMVNWAEGERGIGGAVDEAEDSAHVMIYVEVDDPAAYLERVKANGGEVVTDVMTIPGMVTFATFRDPAGNLMGLVASEIPPA
jgi:predicted enzyme related to lactoylglutathione lyase